MIKERWIVESRGSGPNHDTRTVSEVETEERARNLAKQVFGRVFHEIEITYPSGIVIRNATLLE